MLRTLPAFGDSRLRSLYGRLQFSLTYGLSHPRFLPGRLQVSPTCGLLYPRFLPGRLQISPTYGLSHPRFLPGRLQVSPTCGLSRPRFLFGRLQVSLTCDSLSFPQDGNRRPFSSPASCRCSHAQPVSSPFRPRLHLPRPLSGSTPHPHKCVLPPPPGQNLPCEAGALHCGPDYLQRLLFSF